MNDFVKFRDPFRSFVESVVQTGLLSKGYAIGAPAPQSSADLVVSKEKSPTFAVQFKAAGPGRDHTKKARSVEYAGSEMPLYYVLINSKDETVSVGESLKPALKDVFRTFKVKTSA